jgi:DNA-nicking Smr family endonuclease
VNRRLSEAEAALWARVAATVAPIVRSNPKLSPSLSRGGGSREAADGGALAVHPPSVRRSPSTTPPPATRSPSPSKLGEDLGHTLDATWDRKLARGLIAPDFTLDLHGCTLDAAHGRLDHGLTLALAQGARLVLLVTGRARSGDAGGRGERRGAIRAKFIDWLAAGSHSSRIAAIRPAHPRHGGAGAVYVVLRSSRRRFDKLSTSSE